MVREEAEQISSFQIMKVPTYRSHWSGFKSSDAWLLSHVQLFVTPCTEAHQAPLSMGFSRQEDWSELPFPLLG